MAGEGEVAVGGEVDGVGRGEGECSEAVVEGAAGEEGGVEFVEGCEWLGHDGGG